MISTIRAFRMDRDTLVMIGAITIVLVAVIVGLAITAEPREAHPPPLAETSASLDLGITYLRITPQVAVHYDLGIENGALVTGVATNSPADLAGVSEGDVIISYNGVPLGAEVKFLGMMRECRPGSDVALEIWREDRSRVIQFVHAPRQAENQ
jgi:predicted metalloprotease with PDZ domain